MSVSESHRFLRGIPSTADKRIWVITGQTQDLFFHNAYHGCVGLRRTFELWALENGMSLTIFLDRDGQLDFSGNADPDDARQRFEAARSRRRPRYANRPRPRDGVAGAPGEPGTAERAAAAAPAPGSDQAQERAAEAASQASAAVGGPAQGHLNTFTQVGQVLANRDVPALVLVGDLRSLIQEQDIDPRVLGRIATIIRTDWHDHISENSLLVFLTPQGLEGCRFMQGLLPPEEEPNGFRNVRYVELGGPKVNEVRTAIDRVSRRNGFRLNGAEPIARALVQQGTLRGALSRVRSVVNSGQLEVTLQGVLQLPPLNESLIAEVHQNLAQLTGLARVKETFARLEEYARDLRRRLDAGESRRPDDALHLVFSGSPGTGKTTVARIAGRLFHAVGLLPTDTFVDIDPKDLASSALGESQERMTHAVREARGGVLFIDEAPQLAEMAGPQGKEIVDVLVRASEDLRDQLVVILAGYSEKMPALLAMDPGLASRFALDDPDRNLVFEDYTFDELWSILLDRLDRDGYTVSDDAAARLRMVLQRRFRAGGFGNARGARNLANEIVRRHRTSERRDAAVLAADDVPALIQRDEERYRRAMEQLDAMVGLEPVRTRLQQLVARTTYDVRSLSLGRAVRRLTLHPGNMRFVGPPGTGKTSVARQMAELLYSMGCIARPELVEVSREKLIGRFQGHSENTLKDIIRQGRGGVVFIDEAYALAREENDTFGMALVDTLVRQITAPENSGTVFIIAGYPREIDTFLSRNSGLTGRFPVEIEFPTFSPEDCAEVARRALREDEFTCEDGFFEAVAEVCAAQAERDGELFNNARFVRGLVQEATDRMKQRIVDGGFSDPDACDRVLISDLPTPTAAEEAARLGAGRRGAGPGGSEGRVRWSDGQVQPIAAVEQ